MGGGTTCIRERGQSRSIIVTYLAQLQEAIQLLFEGDRWIDAQLVRTSIEYRSYSDGCKRRQAAIKGRINFAC